MLIWIVALHCEAKPLIDYYRLKKSPHHHAFDLYQNERVVCVVSGIGTISAAAATAWVAALFRNRPSLSWINMGIAGAAIEPVGNIFWINKIITSSGRHFFPVPTFKTNLESRSCQTLDEASNDYPEHCLIDMEASAFFSTATRFSSAELAHCLKIVSDNQTQPHNWNKAATSQLIQDQIETLSGFADKLLTLNDTFSKHLIAPETWQSITEQAHFSQTQQARLKSNLQFLLSRQFELESLKTHISGLNQSRDIIRRLDQLRLDESRNL